MHSFGPRAASVRTIASAWADGRRNGNNFDAVRLMAASAVIFSHSFEIVGGVEASEPLYALTGGQTRIGFTAVLVFFALSGFLLAQSWRAEPRLGRFAWKRALRLLPALLLVVVSTAFVLGPLVSDAPASAYFTSLQTWSYPVNLGPLDPYNGLPGVFAANPYPESVNQPLWTLKYEVLCYGALALAGVAGLLRPAPCAAALIGLYVVDGMGLGDDGGLRAYVGQYAFLGRAFFAGALLALLGDRVALSRWGAAAALAALVAATSFGGFNVAFPVLGAYLVLAIGLSPVHGVKDLGRFGDFSYGLYVWGWPVQQVVQQYLGPPHWAANFALSFAPALLIAILSWRFVERPALALKTITPRLNPAVATRAGSGAGD